MANNTQKIADMSAENKTFYDKTLLKRLLPALVWNKYGQKKSIPLNSGDTINFRRFESLTPATTPLEEGVTPSGSDLQVTPVSATIQQYGDYIEISDKLDMVGIDPVATENSELLGEQAGETLDIVARDVVVVGTNVQNATGTLTGDEVKKAVRTLRRNKAKPFKDGFYVGIVDPETAYDLQNDSLWQDVSKYNGGKNIEKGEIGKLHGVKFIMTTSVKVKEDGKHCTMIIGQDAYGVVDLEGSAQKPEIIIKPLGSSGTEDPLNQRGTQGWKAAYTAVRLNELAMVRIEHTVSE